MTKWVLKNSFLKIIHEEELSLIESWNDVVFYYSKMMNDDEIYKKNYFFFISSMNAPFSKEEALKCLDFSFGLFTKSSFLSSITTQDKIQFSNLMVDIKNALLKDDHDTFSTSTYTA